jgi:hypothetical protein
MLTCIAVAHVERTSVDLICCRDSSADGATAGHSRTRPLCGWRLSSWKRAVLGVLVITLIVGLAVALSIVLSKDRRTPLEDLGPASSPEQSPLLSLAFNATCSADAECVSKLCLNR